MVSRRETPSSSGVTISMAAVLIIMTVFVGRHVARAQVRLLFPALSEAGFESLSIHFTVVNSQSLPLSGAARNFAELSLSLLTAPCTA
jgi:hypothetical protein